MATTIFYTMSFRRVSLCALLFVLIFSACIKTNDPKEDRLLFKVNIETSIDIPSKLNIPVRIQFTNDTISSYIGTARKRGGASIVYPKHSFEIDLNEDLPLAGLSADDDWILNANFIDKTFLRHAISYDLFREMNDHNISARYNYTEVSINGKYNGLYLLMEKLDRSSLKINPFDSSAFIFKEPHIFKTSYEGAYTRDPNNFHQQTYPKAKDKSAEVEKIRRFILDSDERVFVDNLRQYFDLDNLIDWHLLLLISNNNDGILKNFYLYKTDSLTPARIAPWDYDHSFGRDGDNELNLDTRSLKIERSILFSRLIKNKTYLSKLKKRWLQHNQSDLLSKAGLNQRVLAKSKEIKTHTTRNFQRWPLNNYWYKDDNDFDAEIEVMLDFIEIRHDRLSEYFEGL